MAREPGAPALRRLTRTEYENAIHDRFGDDIHVPSNLEPDNEVEGLLSVGASTTSLSAYGVELYEGAASDVTDQVVDDPTRYAAFVPCTPASATRTAAGTTGARTPGPTAAGARPRGVTTGEGTEPRHRVAVAGLRRSVLPVLP